MKIENDLVAQEIARLGQGKQTQNQGGAAFADVLAQAVSDQTAQAAGAVSAPEAIAFNNAPSSAGAVLYEQTNRLLDALDNYGQALGDGSKTLKDIEPLANELEQRANELSQHLESNGNNDLGGIAWQAVTQAQVEAMKFRRGDYV